MHRPARSLGAAGITVSELEGRKNNQFTCCWHLATIFTPPPVGERSIVMRMSVCLSVREHISGTQYNVHVSSLHRISCNGLGSVLHWRRCDTLCTSGFIDDVMFARHGHGNRRLEKAYVYSM